MDIQGKLAMPAIISTGISLSDRFKGLEEQSGSQPQHKLARGGFGYGGPVSPSPSIFSQPKSGLNQSFGNDSLNQLLAKSLFKRHEQLQESQIQKQRFGLRQENLNNMMMKKAPVLSRVGFNTRAQKDLIQGRMAGRGHIGKSKRNVSGHGSGSGGGRVVARGGGRSRGNQPRGKEKSVGTGISPLNRSKAVENGGSLKDKWYGPPKDKSELDKELDAYMSQSKKKTRRNLDQEMDEYMKIAREKSMAAGAVGAASPTNAQGEEDMAMAEDN